MHTKDLFDLSGKVAIITGGGSGLGRQMATALAEMGADVVLCARNAERCAETAAELSALGVRALGLRCDVTSADDVRAMVERAKAELGRIDILVNNAGRAWVAPVATMAVEDWRRVLDVNLTGAFLCSQAARKRSHAASVPAPSAHATRSSRRARTCCRVPPTAHDRIPTPQALRARPRPGRRIRVAPVADPAGSPGQRQPRESSLEPCL